MPLTKYAAIDIGSYMIELKIYEINSDKKINIVENIRYVMELGKETYRYGKLSFEAIDTLCDILYKFSGIMKEYKITEYDAYATSGIREAENSVVILDRIRVKTGIVVKILSNSEERFLSYKALSMFDKEFNEFLDDETAIIDIGSGSMQISLFEKKALMATQNLKLGSLRIRELLYKLSDDTSHFDRLIDELINNDWQTFKKMFLKERQIKNIVATGTQISIFSRKLKNGQKNIVLTREEFMEAYNKLNSNSTDQIAKLFGITEEQAIMIIPCVRIYGKIIEETNAERLWIPCTDLPDGMAVDFYLRNKKMHIEHDFMEDIINTSKNIAKRYKANQGHIQSLREMSVAIFEATKKIHGMGKRQRLLLEISALLHGCGKYISITSSGQCSYDIIMATEIIGISHKEREIVANIVRYNTEEINNLEDLTIAKLIAILRVSNALDRIHKQKFKDYKIELKDNELQIITKTQEDITLEKGLFYEKADFFEEVYGIRPVLKQKKGL